MKKLGLICFLSPLICFSMNTELEPTRERTGEAIAYEDSIQESLILSESELDVHSETAVSSQGDREALEIQPVQRNPSKQNASPQSSYKGGVQDALKRSNRPRVTHREVPESKRSNVVEEKQPQNTLHEGSAIVDDFAEQEHAAPPAGQQQAIPSQSSMDSRAQKLDSLRNPRVRLRPSEQAQSKEQIAAPEVPPHSIQETQPSVEPQSKPAQQRAVPKVRQAPRQSVQTEEKRAPQPRTQSQVKPRQQRTSPALRQAPRQSVQTEEKQEPSRAQRQTQPRQQRSSPATTQNPSRNSVYTEEGQHQQRTSPQAQKQMHRESVSTEEGESKALSYHYTPNRVVLISNAAGGGDSQKRAPKFFERPVPATKENAPVSPLGKVSRKERTQALVDQATAPKTKFKQEVTRSAQPQSRSVPVSRKAPPSQLQRSTNRVAAEREAVQATPVAPGKASPGERAQRKQSNRQKTDKSYHLGRRTAE